MKNKLIKFFFIIILIHINSLIHCQNKERENVNKIIEFIKKSIYDEDKIKLLFYQNKILKEQIYQLQMEYFPSPIFDSSIYLNINDMNKDISIKPAYLSNNNRLGILQRLPNYGYLKTFFSYDNNFNDFESQKINSKIDQSYSIEYTQILFFSKKSYFDLINFQIRNIQNEINNNQIKIFNELVIKIIEDIVNYFYFSKLLSKIDIEKEYNFLVKNKIELSKELGLVERFNSNNQYEINLLYKNFIEDKLLKIKNEPKFKNIISTIENFETIDIENIITIILRKLLKIKLNNYENYNSIKNVFQKINSYPTLTFGIRYKPETLFSFENKSYFEALDYKYNKIDLFITFNLSSLFLFNLKNSLLLDEISNSINSKQISSHYDNELNEIIFLLNSYYFNKNKENFLESREKSAFSLYNSGKISYLEYLEISLEYKEYNLNNFENLKKIISKINELKEVLGEKIL